MPLTILERPSSECEYHRAIVQRCLCQGGRCGSGERFRSRCDAYLICEVRATVVFDARITYREGKCVIAVEDTVEFQSHPYLRVA